MPLRLAAKPQDPWAYSLDRIDNTKGYVRGNVAVMSYKANRLQNEGTAEEHEIIAAWMRKQTANAATDNRPPNPTPVPACPNRKPNETPPHQHTTPLAVLPPP